MKGIHLSFKSFTLLAFALLLGAYNSAWAQSGKSPLKDSLYAAELNPYSVIDRQISGNASDPVQAVHSLALYLSKTYGGSIVNEYVGEQYIVLLQGVSKEQSDLLRADPVTRTVKNLSQPDTVQRSALSVSVSCSFTGLGALYSCTATASGGVSPYSYDWEAANSEPAQFGNMAFIDSCATTFGESYRVTVTDSVNNQDSETGFLDCPFF